MTHIYQITFKLDKELYGFTSRQDSTTVSGYLAVVKEIKHIWGEMPESLIKLNRI